jgi:lipoate-protein ligase A
MTWRLVDSDMIAPEMASAVDEAMLLSRSGGVVPDTLHLYRRNAPSISMGHFEKVAECVDLDAAERHGVALVRRMSGGSAIYTDPGHIIYTVVLGQGSVPESPQETFCILCQGVIAALGEIGIEAEFKPVNDVLVRGRKISGSAQIRRQGAVLQHGTLMVRTDYERMFSVLRGKRPRDGMTSLAEEMTEVPSMCAVKVAMTKGFSSALNVEIDEGELSDEERITADRLVRATYGRREHTFLY